MRLLLECLALQLGGAGGAAETVVDKGRKESRKSGMGSKSTAGPSAVANFEFCQGLLQLSLQVCYASER